MSDEYNSGEYEFSRRQYLSSVAALGALPIVSSDEPVAETTDRFTQRERSGQTASPPYPDDPFMPGQFASQYLGPTEWKGWKPATVREEYRTLLKLHLDVLDSAGLAVFEDGEVRPDQGTSRALSVSKRTGIPATAGRNTTIETNRISELQPVLEEHDWEFPSGSSLDTVSGSFAETIHGEDQVIEFHSTTNGIPSAFAPLGLHLMKVAALKRFEQGFSGFFVDKVFNRHGLDFSEWATATFRDYIKSLPADRREQLAVENPDSFDVKEYLRENNLTPRSGRDPREDPVFREYVIHNHLGVRRYLESFRTALTSEFPDRFENGELALWANQFTGVLYLQQAVNVYGSPYFDVINTELFPTVKPASDYKYKMLQAVGEFEKPVIAKGTLTNVGSELDPTEQYPNLQRFQLAESHANGARLKIPLSPRGAHSADQSITQWIQSDGSVAESLQTAADFVWTHERFLTDAEPQNPVAVIWSLPDRMYRRLPQWSIGGYKSHDGIDTFIGATKLLREAQIPYTVLVFGHPDLWDDSDQLERLSEHDSVVLPDLRCITDDQRSALNDYLEQDGHLVSSGAPPRRNGLFEPRDDIDEIVTHGNTVTLDENPALIRERDGNTSSEFIDALSSAGINSFAERDDSTLSVNVRNQPDANRTIVHLLNYDYSKRTDSFESKRDLQLKVPTPDHSVGVVRYYSPQQTANLEANSEEDSVEFTVPELTDWGFVVLAPSKSDLVNSDDEQPATKTIQSLRAGVGNARDDGTDWSPTFTIAETRLEETTKAMKSNSYSQALAAANEGISAVEKLDRKQPVVGIDLSHGQQASFDRENPFEQLRANIAYPDYELIDSWSNELLKELHILIIPPALAFKGARHDFSSDEIDAISRFVDGGGSLVILSRGGIASDIEPLMDEFGYAFDGRGVMFPKDARPVAPVVNQHELTEAVSEITAKWGTTLTDLPEGATTLAAIPEDNEAWFHTEQPPRERNEAEEDVPGDPVYAVSNHGDGTVAVLGSWAYLHVPEGRTHWTPVMNNLFLTLSRAAVHSDRDGTIMQSQGENKTVSETPGFGALGVIGGIAGSAALARQWRINGDDDSPGHETSSDNE